MAKPKEVPVTKRIGINEIRAQLDHLTAKLKVYESVHSTNNNSNFLSDGLRLSQEVEILQKQNTQLREENTALKKQVACAEPAEAGKATG